ncbi:MAG: hypothetical protein GX577_16140 [Leptolinea sp.]|nr:hypothetical protein [Leptolinea sp.]
MSFAGKTKNTLPFTLFSQISTGKNNHEETAQKTAGYFPDHNPCSLRHARRDNNPGDAGNGSAHCDNDPADTGHRGTRRRNVHGPGAGGDGPRRDGQAAG